MSTSDLDIQILEKKNASPYSEMELFVREKHFIIRIMTMNVNVNRRKSRNL